MASLVHAIIAAEELTRQNVIVIGGLAVICRLSTAHRATTDLDIVDRHDDAKESQLQLLLASTRRPSGPSGTVVPTPFGGIQVDVIEVSDSDVADLPEDPTGRLFVLAHAWAAETATPVMIRAQQSSAVEVRVAEPGPLVAMKLQSTIDRGAAKEGTDLLDTVRLVLDPHTGPVARSQITHADERIREAIYWHANWCFQQHAERSLARIRQIPEGSDTQLDDLDLVYELLTQALSS